MTFETIEKAKKLTLYSTFDMLLIYKNQKKEWLWKKY